ncbi:MAG: HD domain-containing protein [Oscillospiraceae bacterium]|nr:HD domain-containing protein [Oscillospiraceae bacterium]
MILPDYVNKIITALESAGYEAYAVGGCVRDMMLGLTPSDYDVTTSATPDEVKTALGKVACSIHDTGLKHGTVTVSIDNNAVEITTFRIDGEYTDNRRPESVIFTNNLRDDLSRRDFTINAMAFSEKTGIVDYFNGREDLKGQLIRAVGDPQKRFNEDGLRILRAIRFAAVYGFTIEPETSAAVHQLRELIKNIAGERIAQELNKLVCGRVSEVIAEYTDVFAEFIPELHDCKGFDQHSKYHDRDVLTHTLNAMDLSPPDKATRLALLLHDTGKPQAFKLVEKKSEPDCFKGSFKGHAAISAEIARKTMRRLKYDNDTLYNVLCLIKFHSIPINADEKAVKRLLNRFGEDLFFRLIDVHIADDSAKAEQWRKRVSHFHEAAKTAREIIAQNSCFSLKQLAVKGGDLVEMGYRNKEIGAGLNFLLQAVIDEKCENERNKLLTFLTENKRSK